MKISEYESIIADAMKGVATEMRLADARELVALVHGKQTANLADLVNSSTEMFFKNGTVRYALSADCNVSWQASPEIKIDMEFCHERVCAFFRLILGRRQAGIELVKIIFEEDGLDESGKIGRLASAIAAARTCH